MDTSPITPKRARSALLLGFGGLLILLLLSGVDAIHVLSQAQARNDLIRQAFLERNRALEKIRSEIYLSGTYIRDYLLDPEQPLADEHRRRLGEIRGQIQAELTRFRTLVRPEESPVLASLDREIQAYWQTLAPAFSWNSAQRRQNGYLFLRDEVFPRRTTMLGIADRIAELNEAELTEGGQLTSEMFSGVRTRLIIGLIVVVVLGLVHAAVTSAHILRLERQNATHLEDAMTARQELRGLSAGLVNAQENERKAISRELHDAVGQALSAVLFELQNHRAKLTSPELRADLDVVLRQVESTVAMVRNMALLLRPSMLDDLGLAAALEWLARDVSRQTGIVADVSADDSIEELPDEHRTAIFRIVQEALHNISRHSGAHSVRIAVRQDGQRVTATVQDDGRGFQPGLHRGLGLVGMQERTESLGGTLRVESPPGQGTRIEITLPLDAGSLAHA